MNSKLCHGITWADDISECVVSNCPIFSSVSINTAYVILGADPCSVLEKAVFDKSLICCNIGIGRVRCDF